MLKKIEISAFKSKVMIALLPSINLLDYYYDFTIEIGFLKFWINIRFKK